MMVDPGNRLVADTLEADWNEKLRALAKARDERERARREDQIVIDDAIRERLVVMTSDFQRLWSDPSTPNRERKRMLAYVIEDATLVKLPREGTTKVHVRFKGGQTTTVTTTNPKASWQKVKTPTEIVKLVDRLLDDHLYAEIAEILNARGLRPGGAARPGKGGARFTALLVQYIVHAYGLHLRRDRLRARGLLYQKGTRCSSRDPRSHSHELGATRHRQGACVQWPRVALRGADESAGKAQQPMGSTHGQSRVIACIREIIMKVLRSNRRRCSMKTVGFGRAKSPDHRMPKS